MTTEFVQTDAEANPIAIDALCSGNLNNADTESNQCDRNGSPGVGARSISLGLVTVDRNAVWMEIVNLEAYNGAAGDWTWRINITAGTSNASRLDEVHICHVNSSYAVKNTLASGTGLGISVQTTGVKSGTVSQASPVSVATDDRIIVIFAFDNPGFGLVAFSYVPDQNITGPGDIVPIVGGQWVAGQSYVPGFKQGQVYNPGFQQGQAYIPGFKQGQSSS